MLNDYEKHCLSHFLSIIDEVKVKNLASSVTVGRLQCNTREEAINAILLHTVSLSSFFNRRKVTAALLFNYIHHLKESLPGDASKEMLLRRIFEKWQLPRSSHDQSHCDSNYIPPTGNQISLINAEPQQPMYHNSLKEMVNSQKLLKEVYNMAYDEFLLQFAKIYFDLMNQSTLSSTYVHGLDTTHFFNDCKLFIRIQGNEEIIEESAENVEDVLRMLSDLKQQHKLTFVPCLSPEGVRGKTESHGLIYAVVCGTLDKERSPVGVFEQSFILRKDPYAKDSHKIMESTLNLRSSNAVTSYSQLMLGATKNMNNTLAIENASDQLHLK